MLPVSKKLSALLLHANQAVHANLSVIVNRNIHKISNLGLQLSCLTIDDGLIIRKPIMWFVPDLYSTCRTDNGCSSLAHYSLTITGNSGQI